MPIYYQNKATIKKEIDDIKDLLPKFKYLKEDCFYINWNFKNRKWVYFDKRFDEKTKSLLANFLYAEGRKNYLVQQVRHEMPIDKMFSQFTNEDWTKLDKSKNRIELVKIQNELIKIRKFSELIIQALNVYSTSGDNLQSQKKTKV